MKNYLSTNDFPSEDGRRTMLIWAKDCKLVIRSGVLTNNSSFMLTLDPAKAILSIPEDHVFRTR